VPPDHVVARLQRGLGSRVMALGENQRHAHRRLYV
jgi:hypothetical protein